MSEICGHFIAERRPGKNQIRITLSEHENHGHTKISYQVTSKNKYVRKAFDAAGLDSKILEESQENVDSRILEKSQENINSKILEMSQGNINPE